MTDQIDRANEIAAAYNDDGIAAARRALETRELEPCGACHWCGAELPRSSQIFCDAVCASDYASNKRRNGT